MTLADTGDDITCQSCRFTDNFDAFDVVGACPGNVFCPECNTEIDSSTGAVMIRCGKCQWCREMATDNDDEPRQQTLGLH